MAYETEIARLEAILDAGASSTDVDGTRVSYDLDKVRQRLAELKRLQDKARRPRSSSIDLSGF